MAFFSSSGALLAVESFSLGVPGFPASSWLRFALSPIAKARVNDPWVVFRSPCVSLASIDLDPSHTYRM